MITLKKIIEVLGPIETYKGGRWMPVKEEFQQKFDHDLEFGRLEKTLLKPFKARIQRLRSKQKEIYGKQQVI